MAGSIKQTSGSSQDMTGYGWNVPQLLTHSTCWSCALTAELIVHRTDYGDCESRNQRGHAQPRKEITRPA